MLPLRDLHLHLQNSQHEYSLCHKALSLIRPRCGHSMDPPRQLFHTYAS